MRNLFSFSLEGFRLLKPGVNNGRSIKLNSGLFRPNIVTTVGLLFQLSRPLELGNSNHFPLIWVGDEYQDRVRKPNIVGQLSFFFIGFVKNIFVESTYEICFL